MQKLCDTYLRQITSLSISVNGSRKVSFKASSVQLVQYIITLIVALGKISLFQIQQKWCKLTELNESEHQHKGKMQSPIQTTQSPVDNK